MPFFRCLIRGENFLLSLDETDSKFLGFLTTRYVEAKNCNEAELKALEMLRSDETLKNEEIAKNSPDAKVYFEEIEQINYIPENVPKKGHTFFPMNEEV